MIVTLVSLVATVLVARVRRRAVIWLTVGITAAVGVSWWIVARIRTAVLDRIVAPDSREAIRSLMRETTESFRTYIVVVLAIAIVAGLVAFVSAHLDEIARGIAWAQRQAGDEPTRLNTFVTTHYDGLRMAGFAVAAVALLVVGIALVPFIVIGSLLGLYVLALAAIRRDTADVDAALSDT